MQQYVSSRFVIFDQEQRERVRSITYHRHGRWVDQLLSNDCTLPHICKQEVVAYINRQWDAAGFPYRLVSDPPRARWSDPKKVLRVVQISLHPDKDVS